MLNATTFLLYFYLLLLQRPPKLVLFPLKALIFNDNLGEGRVLVFLSFAEKSIGNVADAPNAHGVAVQTTAGFGLNDAGRYI